MEHDTHDYQLRHRNVAHLWSDKRVVRFFRKHPVFKGPDNKKHRKNLRSVYFALCEIDSDFGEGKSIKGFRKTVASYADMDVKTIGTYIIALNKARLIHVEQERDDSGEFQAKQLRIYEWVPEREDEAARAIANELEIDIEDLYGETENPLAVKPPSGKTDRYKNPSNEGPTSKNPSEGHSNAVGESIAAGKLATKRATQLMDLWNKYSVHSGLPRVTKLSPSRKRLITDAIKKHGFSDVRRAIYKAHRTPFCCGEGDTGWKLDFDRLLKPETNRSRKPSIIISLLEGRYDREFAPSHKIGSKRERGMQVNGDYAIRRNGEPLSLNTWTPIANKYDENDRKISTTWKHSDGRTVESLTRPKD